MVPFRFTRTLNMINWEGLCTLKFSSNGYAGHQNLSACLDAQDLAFDFWHSAALVMLIDSPRSRLLLVLAVLQARS